MKQAYLVTQVANGFIIRPANRPEGVLVSLHETYIAREMFDVGRVLTTLDAEAKKDDA